MARPPRWLVVTPVLGALALGAAGAWFYFAQRQYLQQVASANLLVVAQAKLDEIVTWRTERLGDAAVLQESPLFVRAVAQWLAGRQPEIAADILTRLRSTKDHHGYDDVRLVDRAGRVVLAASGRLGALDPDEAGSLRSAFRDRRPTMGDMHVSIGDSIPHLAVVAPLFASSARAAEPLGAVVHVVDPRRSLFRLVESWPSPSPSAEALLVRRDGDSVLFLTPRRFQPGAAPTLRIPLSRPDVPAVMAVLGTEGIVRGVDYRGVRVISALRAVPGTPWFLVVKEDESEALAVWRLRTALVFAVLLGLVLAAGATAIALGQRSATAHYRRLYEAEAALGASEVRFRTLVEEAGDGFALLDAEGRYLDVNSACCLQLGYSREELLRLSISDIDSLFNTQQFAADFQSLVDKPPSTYESEHRRKDGTTFPVEVTLSIARIGGVPQALSLARDITERKRAVEMVRESQREIAEALEFNRSILRTSSIGILVYRQSGQCTFANEAAAKMVGTDVAGLLALDFHRIQSWKDSGLYDTARKALATDTEQQVEAPLVTTFGRDVWLNLRFSTFHSGGERHLLVFAYDVTERKRAEERLKTSSQLLRNTGEMAQVGGWELDLSTKEVSWTEEVYRIHGVEPGHKPKLEEALDFYAPESRPALEEALKKAAETGEPYALDSLFIPRGSKDKIWVRSLGRAVYSGGKVVKLAGTFQNIDKYKRVEEALRREQTMLARTEAVAHVGSWEWDITPDTVIWSDELFRIFQRDPREGAPSFAEHPALYHPHDMVCLRQAVEVAVAEGTPYELELRAIRKDGETRVCVARGIAEMSPGGRAVRLVGSLQDITERKRAEEALRESEERHRLLFETESDAIFLVDCETGRFIAANPSAERMYGYSRDEFLGLKASDVSSEPEKTRQAIAAEEAHVPVRLHRRKNGTVFPVEISGSYFDDHGRRVHVAAIRDITERKQAEEALREREQELRVLFEELPVGVSLLDQNRKITYANPRLEEILGLSRDDLLQGRHQGRRYLRSDGTPMPPEEYASVRAFREQRPIHAVETGILVEDGRTIWTSVSAAPFPAPNEGVLVVTADITERKRAEEALRDSEVRYRTILATALDGFWLADMQGRLLEVNEAYSRMSGYSRQELLAMRISDLEAMETRAETAARIERIGMQGADRFESRHRRKDGSVYDVDISVQFQPMEGGRMVVIVRDITERKRAEEALRESEERHRGIIEQLNDVYYRTDRDGRITMMSPSAAHVFGFPSTGEMIGRPIESLWQYPSQRAALLAAIGERGFVRDYETTAVRTDGTPFAVAVSSHYVRDASGAADGVEGIIRDITERKQAETALRALARHLDSVREEEHTRIARQVHDELGQALTALRLDLTWVGRKIPKGNTALRRRIDAAVALTDETITVGQRIVGELRPPILDDLGLVPAVEWYAQHFAKRSGLRIEFDVGAEEPVVPDHLAVAAYRIVQEALSNVARHAQATHARVRLGEQDGALTIEIRDDGQGFPEEAIRSPRSFGIVGMRERAASQGGELVITSSPGAGTTVRVTFPLECREEPRVPR